MSISTTEKISSGDKFLNVKNVHHGSFGEPPILVSNDGCLSYFENEYGEHWVFAMGPESKALFIADGATGRGNRIVGE